MNKEEIIEHIKGGWALRNHGKSWFLFEPQRPYCSRKSVPVDDAIVNSLEADGILEIEIPYTSAIAKLRESI